MARVSHYLLVSAVSGFTQLMRGVGWETIWLVGAILVIATSMIMGDTGIVTTFASLVVPMIYKMGFTLFYVFLAIFLCIITQFSMNMILQLVFAPILAPVVAQMGYNPMVIGLDSADPVHLQKLMDQGRVPHMKNMKEGDFEVKFTPHIIKSDNKDCVVMGDQFDEMKKQTVSVSAMEDFVWTTPTFDYPMHAEPPGLDMCHLGKAGNLADILETPVKNPSNWSFELPSGARECTVFLAKNTVRRFAILSASDGVHYDTCTLYKNKRTEKPLAVVKGIGNWGDFIIDTYMKEDEEIQISYKVFMFDMAQDRSNALIYFSHVTNISNLDFFYPKAMGKELYETVGPMLQFGKVFGDEHELAELAHKLLLESYAKEQCAWHANATDWLFQKYPDWQLYYVHLHSIDNFQHWFMNYTLPGTSHKPEYYLDIIDRCYEENDKFVGRMMAYLDEDTTKVMSALGYTVLKPGGTATSVEIDWEQTKAISARTSYIYVNLKGREQTGIVEPEDYDQLVQEIISDLYSYRDEKGERVIAHCFTRDEMEYLGMGGSHCGDILFQLRPTYCCEHANCFSTVKNEGWSLANLCFMGGAGVKQGVRFRRPVRITDIVPTICHLTDTPMPADVEGGIIYQALK